ncbi:hypothetical protein F5887DRAFT_962811 [Amanita rubescens]|nr:hypothetical protein F5887DRAFT_962811 [Amanita rubescens]
MWDSQEEISRLLDQSNFNEQDEISVLENRSYSHPKRSNLLFVAVAVLVVLVAVDIAAYTYITRLLFSQVGLDDLEYRSSRYNRTINMPRRAVQVYETYPDKVSAQGDHQWLSDFGTLAPPDRHLQVNGTGLTPRLPHPFSLGDESTPNISLDVCQLDTARTDLERVSWGNRPRCVKRVALLRGTRGIETESEPLACASGSHLTFEISCAAENPSCQLDVWSNQNATWGIFMYQYQTA